MIIRSALVQLLLAYSSARVILAATVDLKCPRSLSAVDKTTREQHSEVKKVKLNRNYRLPNNTVPDSYVVSITTRIHKGDFNFNGDVSIGIVAVENSSNITLHMQNLTILRLNVLSSGLQPVAIPIDHTSYDEKTEFLVIHLRNQLERTHKYSIHIKYVGVLGNDSNGIHREFYTNENGAQRWLLATHFDPQAARSAFPCYDEPAKRASITVRITHDPTYHALSNMPEAVNSPITNADGTITTFFDPTPPMSTCLTAFVVSDFIGKSLNSPIPHRVYSKGYAINQTDRVLNTGAKVLEAIGKYLNFSYALPKMDQVALPVYGSAMENWGLVVYGEEFVLYNESVDIFTKREYAQALVSHEFGHQWFGNLVSPRWWTYLWLNEGFATFFTWKGIDLIYPDEKMMDLFITQNVINCLFFDSTTSTRPMTYYVEDPVGVLSQFDKFNFVTYDKAGSVINMFSHAFTERSFRKGLNNYLQKKKFSNAAEEDLFAGLQRAVTEDNTLDPNLRVDTIMYSWTQQSGYPILYVHHHADGVIEVVQQRFVDDIYTPADDTIWWIPYNFVTASDRDSSGTSPDGWLSQKSTNITQSDNRRWSAEDWVVFNKEHTGYYRVMYEEQNYRRLANALAADRSILQTSTKTQLINDLKIFIETQRFTDYTLFLDVVRFLADEIEYGPWIAANSTLTGLNIKLAGSHAFHLFEIFVRNLITKLYKTVGINDLRHEPFSRKYARNLAIHWACEKGVPECHNKQLN